MATNKIKKLKSVDGLFTFKEGKALIADQLNVNFEALVTAINDNNEVFNLGVEVLNTLNTKVAKINAIEAIVSSKPVTTLATLTRTLGTSSTADRHNYTITLSLNGANINDPNADIISINVDEEADKTGDIFDGTSKSRISYRTLSKNNFNLYYTFTEVPTSAPVEQVYTFYIEAALSNDPIIDLPFNANPIDIYKEIEIPGNVEFELGGTYVESDLYKTMEWVEQDGILDGAIKVEFAPVIIDEDTINELNERLNNMDDTIADMDSKFENKIDEINAEQQLQNDAIENNSSEIAGNKAEQDVINSGFREDINSNSGKILLNKNDINQIKIEQITQNQEISTNSVNNAIIIGMLESQVASEFYGTFNAGIVTESATTWQDIVPTQVKNSFGNITYSGGIFTVEEDFDLLTLEIVGQVINNGQPKTLELRVVNTSGVQIGDIKSQTTTTNNIIAFPFKVPVVAGGYKFQVRSTVGGGTIEFSQGSITITYTPAGMGDVISSSQIVDDSLLNQTAGINGILNIARQNEVDVAELKVEKLDNTHVFENIDDGTSTTTTVDYEGSALKVSLYDNVDETETGWVKLDGAHSLSSEEVMSDDDWNSGTFDNASVTVGTLKQKLSEIKTDTASIIVSDVALESPTGVETTQQEINKKLKLIYNQLEID